MQGIYMINSDGLTLTPQLLPENNTKCFTYQKDDFLNLSWNGGSLVIEKTGFKKLQKGIESFNI